MLTILFAPAMALHLLTYQAIADNVLVQEIVTNECQCGNRAAPVQWSYRDVDGTVRHV
jgi:hypothetical protein